MRQKVGEKPKLINFFYGAMAKFKIGSGYAAGLIPYIRGGAGLYTGSIDMDFTDELNQFGLEDTEVDLKKCFWF